MSRVKGAINIKSFSDRDEIATTSSKTIKHISEQVDSTPLKQFRSTIKHQRNYLKWIDSRHKELLKAKKKSTTGGRGPKDAIYRKYKWYAEQITLLETVNAFELFYKNTFICLAKALRRFIAPNCIKGSVDAKVLWATEEKTSFVSLIFEHQLYHDLEQVDKISHMLVDGKRYSPNNQQAPLRKRVISLQSIFQIRHTLSHNQGKITQSDKTKLEMLGYHAKLNEVIDPSKDHLGSSIRELLLKEANEYTNWLLEQSAKYLHKKNENENIRLPP